MVALAMGRYGMKYREYIKVPNKYKDFYPFITKLFPGTTVYWVLTSKLESLNGYATSMRTFAGLSIKKLDRINSNFAFLLVVQII